MNEVYEKDDNVYFGNFNDWLFKSTGQNGSIRQPF